MKQPSEPDSAMTDFGTDGEFKITMVNVWKWWTTSKIVISAKMKTINRNARTKNIVTGMMITFNWLISRLHC